MQFYACYSYAYLLLARVTRAVIVYVWFYISKQYKIQH